MDMPPAPTLDANSLDDVPGHLLASSVLEGGRPGIRVAGEILKRDGGTLTGCRSRRGDYGNATLALWGQLGVDHD